MSTSHHLLTLLLVALSAYQCSTTVVQRSKNLTYATPSWTTPTVYWHNCTKPSTPSNVECAELAVPLDWNNPQSQHINLGINRIRATSPEHRLGSLVFNPGGPGGSATQEIALSAENPGVLFSEDLQAHYDIIGLDPRGVLASTGLICEPGIWNERVCVWPTDETSFQELVEHNRALGESCVQRNGDLVNHMDTISVARDLEAVRAALREGGLNFLGFSYGTVIGAQYVELYPDNINRMVIDGNCDHSVMETSVLVSTALTYETEVVRFADWCGNNITCVLHGHDILQLLDDLLVRAKNEPIPAPMCAQSGDCWPSVSDEDILVNIQNYITVKDRVGYPNWLVLGQALAEASEGNATLLSYPTYKEEYNYYFGFFSNACQEWSHASTAFSDIQERQELMKWIAPHTRGIGYSWQIQTQCIGWPTPMQNPPHWLNVPSSVAPVLLVSSLYNAEAPYDWGVGLHQQIPNSVLLTRDGDGHTSYPVLGETHQAIDAYLINGTMPAPGTLLMT